MTVEVWGLRVVGIDAGFTGAPIILSGENGAMDGFINAVFNRTLDNNKSIDLTATRLALAFEGLDGQRNNASAFHLHTDLLAQLRAHGFVLEVKSAGPLTACLVSEEKPGFSSVRFGYTPSSGSQAILSKGEFIFTSKDLQIAALTVFSSLARLHQWTGKPELLGLVPFYAGAIARHAGQLPLYF